MRSWQLNKRGICYLALGLGTGLFSSLCGVGGGCILMPFLVNFFRLDIKRAGGTSLATIIPIVTVGSAVHFLVSNGNTDTRAGLFLALFCITGSFIGSSLLARSKPRSLNAVLALFLLIVGLKLVGLITLNIAPKAPAALLIVIPAMALAGLTIGALSALLGVGCGLLIVPLLLWYGLGIHPAVATSLFIMIPITITGTILHRRLSLIDTDGTKVLIPGAVAGAIAGALISRSLSVPDLTSAFGIFMLLASVKMLIEVFFGGDRTKAPLTPVKNA